MEEKKTQKGPTVTVRAPNGEDMHVTREELLKAFEELGVDGHPEGWSRDNKSPNTFIFTDKRFEQHPDLKKKLAGMMDQLLCEEIEKKESLKLLHGLKNIEKLGYHVEVRMVSDIKEQERAHETSVRERQAHDDRDDSRMRGLRDGVVGMGVASVAIGLITAVLKKGWL